MKSILMSIRPEWCVKIFDGAKTIEVRKTRPLIDMPFKVYVYCTKGKSYLYKNPNDGELFLDCNGGYRGGDYEDRFLTSKVIGSFVCDRIDDIEPCSEYYSNGYDIDDDILTKTCLTQERLREYGKGKTLYGYHITEPTLFEKPKELSEFTLAKGLCAGRASPIRPPVSWCYIEGGDDE